MSKTSVVRRPIPRATCLTPNCDSFAAAVAVAMTKVGVEMCRGEVRIYLKDVGGSLETHVMWLAAERLPSYVTPCRGRAGASGGALSDLRLVERGNK